ncbi:ABC transporter ATP-binding protein [Nocardia sp. NPDC003482]
MDNAIEISELRKSFGRTQALDGVDLQVAVGQVHGFLGPNGAGKSTTIRILLGLLKADSGRVRLLNADPWLNAVGLHRRLAYVPGDVELWPNLTGGEVIDLLGRLGGKPSERIRSRRAELIERFDLDPTKKCRTYSKGNRQKVAIVAALAADVELLILDEPTSGLDPLMETVFQDVVTEMKQQGRTVLLSSHILSQVEKLADRISIIKQGRIVETGTLDEMRHLSHTTVEVRTTCPADGLAVLPGTSGFETTGDGIRFTVDGEYIDDVMRELTRLGIRSISCHPPTLEELMLRHYSIDSAGEHQEYAR